MQLINYVMDMLPVVAGAMLMVAMRYLRLKTERIEVTSRPLITLATIHPLDIPARLPATYGEIALQARDPTFPGALLYYYDGSLQEFNGCICDALSPKDSITEKVARDIMIMSGRNPAGSVSKRLRFLEFGIFDAYDRACFSGSGTRAATLRMLQSQSRKVYDMLLTYGGKGGTLMHYIDTYGIEQI